MSTAKIKQHDTARSLEDTLQFGGTAIDLTGCAVSCIIKHTESAITIYREATIVDAPAGRVRFDIQPGDTDVAGTYRVEWEIVFPSGKVLTVPDDSYHTLHILRDLG
ncbi:MAG TPA: BppU family phage baseplate upper protein [Methylomirabilota bacterium]|nr:BppU family phage baseplate upper protein [Methylomirabilota bacterium]